MLLSLQIYCHLIAPISVFASSVLIDGLLHLYVQTMHNIILIDKVFLVAGFVSWTQVCGCSSLEHTSGSVDFSELARALRVLGHRPHDWTEDDIISIVDELTSKTVYTEPTISGLKCTATSGTHLSENWGRWF